MQNNLRLTRMKIRLQIIVYSAKGNIAYKSNIQKMGMVVTLVSILKELIFNNAS